MKFTLSTGALAIAALLSACASTRTVPPALVSARTTVQSAAADEQVLRNAPLELKKASDSLRRADELNASGAKMGDIESAAYVASRQAEAAVSIARAKASEDAIQSSEAERERARADARAAEARRAQAQAAAARAEASSARVEASVAQQQAELARAEVNDAEARSALARQQAAAAQAQAQALQQQLAELQAKPTDRGMLVTLGDVLFEFGHADIKPTSQDALRKLAVYLKAHPERRVLIEGFTDSVGSDAANQALSARRAEAVAAALASLGVAGDRISTRGYGEAYPVAANTSDTNRALNRRVEVYISDNDRPVRARG